MSQVKLWAAAAAATFLLFASLTGSLVHLRARSLALHASPVGPLAQRDHPVLGRADPTQKDHREYLLFAHPAVGAVHTAVHPDAHGGVNRPLHSPRALWNTLAATVQHITSRLTGALSGQTKATLEDVARSKARRAFTVQAAGVATDQPAPAATPAEEQQAQDGELLVTYLVHFAPSVALTSDVLSNFESTTGLKLGDYFPHHSYVLVATPAQVARLRLQVSNDLVDWVGEYPNEAKVVSPDLADLMALPERMLDEAEAWTNLALNIQLQPRPDHQPREIEETQRLAELVQEFLTRHLSFPLPVEMIVRPSFANDLIILRTSGSAKARDVVHLLTKLSELVEVAFLERRVAHKLHNEIAQTITQSGSATPTGGPNNDGRPIWARGIRGEGQLVGCADSGVDWDHCMFNGLDGPAPGQSVNANADKVVAYLAFGDSEDDSNGHGTHVVGSIAGNAFAVQAANGEIAQHSGQAPAAKVYFQDIGVTGGGLEGLDRVGDLGSGLFSPAYDAGARIHSDSWGSSQNTYTTEAQSVDRFIWQNGGKTDKHILILVAAGNDGLKQGSVQSTVGSPATAKNILAVGASQTSTQGWLDSLEYTDWEMKRREAASQLGVSLSNFDCCTYRSNPAVPKYCCKEYNRQQILATPEQHNEENMADFSSRGPTSDGRVKPEIVAPGQYIISARSDGAKSGTNQCTSIQSALLSMAGTSMATPTLAGNAALVRQYLVEGWYPGGTKGSSTQFADPSAALIAAVLINGAQSLTGMIDQNNDGTTMKSLENGIFPLSVFQGFGRVTLDRSLWFQGETRYRHWLEDQRVAIATGGDEDYCLTTNARGPVKATLVWHDAPGSVGGGVAAVNNLDLYMGTSAEQAVAGNFVVRRDVLNNVESGFLEVPGGTKFFVKVRGINVPRGPQYYALVLSGPFDPATVQVGPVCGAQQAFAINQTRFEETTDSDHFPLGPVVGGTVGGVGGLALLGVCARMLFNRYRQTGKII